MNYQKLSPKAKGCMYVAGAIAALIGIAGILGLNEFLWQAKQITAATYISYGVIVLIIVNFLVSPIVRYHRYAYLINDECIDVKEGYFMIERRIVPIERLHKISMERGPIDRMFGLTKVIVTTAGGDVTLRFLEDEKAEFITQQLMRKINMAVIEAKKQQEALLGEANCETRNI